MFIHPTAIVETKEIGKDVYIGPFCYISERVILEDGCRLVGHSSIGQPAQYKIKRFENEGNYIIVGKGTEIREFVTVNAPTYSTTKIGKNCFLMANVHIPHDCQVGDDVVFVVGTAIGGRSIIGDHCYFGLNSSVHNRSEIGAYSVIGAGSFFKGKTSGGLIWAGVPAKPLKVNSVGIDRNAPEKERNSIKEMATEHLKNLYETGASA
jgi:UDP-N-acetylglucosamine acyltransferase